jgi:hypothetical protein
MAVVNIYETAALMERLVIVDASAIEDQEIYNKTGEVMELTFVKDVVRGNKTVLEADDTVPLGDILPGGSLTVTAQQITDAIAAGNHGDIFTYSKREITISTINDKHIVIGGITQPGKSKKKK